jgi:glyoxylase-like metal-dependent hydrolase (beta-lactamase superfamily II)
VSVAVLVDTFLSANHTRELADWILASGSHLTTIYLTHAYGDHFPGLLPEAHNAAHVAANLGVIGLTKTAAIENADLRPSKR